MEVPLVLLTAIRSPNTIGRRASYIDDALINIGQSATRPNRWGAVGFRCWVQAGSGQCGRRRVLAGVGMVVQFWHQEYQPQFLGAVVDCWRWLPVACVAAKVAVDEQRQCASPAIESTCTRDHVEPVASRVGRGNRSTEWCHVCGGRLAGAPIWDGTRGRAYRRRHSRILGRHPLSAKIQW